MQTGLRANLAIGAGTYMNANYAAEPGTLKNIIGYLPVKNAALRLEIRTFNSKDRIFTKRNGASDASTAISFSTAVSL